MRYICKQKISKPRNEVRFDTACFSHNFDFDKGHVYEVDVRMCGFSETMNKQVHVGKRAKVAMWPNWVKGFFFLSDKFFNSS